MMYSKFAIPDMQFFITKINGADVCSLSTEEAVQLFLDASDPILIEVYRKRIPNCSNKQVDASEAAKCDPVNRLSIVAEKDSVIHPKQSMLSARIGYCTASTNLLQRDDSMDSCAEEVASSSSSKKQHLTLYFPPPPPLVLNDNTSYNDCTHGDMENAVSVSDAISNTVEYAYRDDSIYQPQPPPAPSLPQDIDESDITDKPQLISTAMQTEVSNFVSLFHVANASTTDQMIEEEHNLFEACLAPEIDIEEITLRKSDSNEHLGLTVCYSMSGSTGNGSGTCQAVNDITSGLEENESCTEVFISDIQPDSIAARDGRLRQGDQILQVNGKDVTNKKETETLIAENNNAVTLLDEDDFNDTCVAGLDVDDEEDDEDEEFYDENNLTYENCFISSNECSTTADSQLNRVLLAASPPQITTSVMTTPTAKIATTTTTTLAATPNLVAAVSATTTNKHDDAQARSNSSTTSAMTLTSPIKTTPTVNTKNKYYSRGQLLLKYDPLNHQSIKAHLKQVNQELAMLDCRVENLMIKPQGVVGTTTLALDHVDYDTEHIYETIPEDSESEPFYCSPYESSSYVGPSAPGNNQNPCTEQVHLQQQKQRVVAWLGMQTAQRTHHFMNTNGRSNTIVQYPHGIPPMETSMSGTTTTLSTRSKSGTVRSAATNTTTGTTGSSSSGGGFGHNEQDNSSSAYNTGGSNNSITALTLVLNQSNTRMNNDACDMDQQLSALRISKSQRLISPKDKLTSPKHQNAGPTASSLIKIPGPSTTRAAGIINNDIAVPPPPSRSQQQQTQTGSNQKISTNTMYTNVANLQQTMLLQQQLFRQALTQQQQSHSFNFQPQQHLQENTQQSLQLHACPQFTAPNLSQYHFVSSQEGSPEKMRVAAVAAAKASSTEVPMVWKVKRRQDGTRYIVRRPARTRMLRDRALRINAERENYDLTTTEDDTISEIKTGRYWTREERKKHIERARERRQQQQQQLATVTTMRIGDKPIAELPIASSKCQVPKEKPQITVGQQNVSKLHRQASAKLQHHQLQFGSTAPHTADIQTATSLGSCPKVTTALLSSGCIKQKLLSNKNSINKTNNSCSQGEPSGLITPSNVAVPEVNGLEQLSSAATSNANGNSITPTANISGVVVTGAAVQPGQQYQQQQAVALSQTTVGNNKMGLLSVTTV